MTNIALSVQLDAAIEHTFALVDQARDRSFRAANTETVHLYGMGSISAVNASSKAWAKVGQDAGAVFTATPVRFERVFSPQPVTHEAGFKLMNVTKNSQRC